MNPNELSSVYKIDRARLELAYHKYVLEGPEDDCWNWLGAVDSAGYGTYHFTEARVRAHHISYVIHYGLIPTGSQINHKCDNPACINPNHLYAGTQAQNVQDMIDRSRLNPFRLISKEDQASIIELRLTGRSIPSLAKQFNYDVKTVGSLLYRNQIYVNTYIDQEDKDLINTLRHTGHTFKEISQIVGRTLGSVRACFYRGRNPKLAY